MSSCFFRCCIVAGVLFLIGFESERVAIAGENATGNKTPRLLTSLKLDAPLEFCGEKVPLHRQEVKERFEKELLLSLWNRPQVILWLKRAPRYLPYIEQILKESNLPDDLKYIAVAESALLPHAGSRKGAVGFWQFTRATGRKYGLVIDANRDDRRNIYAATAAAVTYFKKLYQDLQSWTLVAAAYNMGEEGLMAEMLEQVTNDYYRLYLPLETQRYVFRILAVKLVLKNPSRYGFNLAADETYPPVQFDSVEVECEDEVSLRVVAQAAKTDFKVIKDLNPELRGHYLPAGNHKIRIPRGAAKAFDARYKDFEKKYMASRKERIYIVRPGDNLSVIAERFGIPLAALIIWNRVDLDRPIHPGDRLIIYGEEDLPETD